MAATVYEIADMQTYLGQNVENVFHYVDSAGSTDIDGLLDNYVDDVLPLVTPLQSTELSHVALRYRQIYPAATLTLERAITPAVDGVESGDPLASYYAASGKWTLANPTVDLESGSFPHILRGGVRICGVVESNVAANAMVSGYISAWADWVAELRNPGAGAFLLAVVSFLGPGPRGSRTRMETAQQYTIISGGSEPAPSTQNSRKFLRGRAS